MVRLTLLMSALSRLDAHDPYEGRARTYTLLRFQRRWISNTPFSETESVS